MFWNREQLPPELKDKKPEEITAALKRLEELENQSKDFETTKSDLETRLNTQQTEYEQVKNRLQEMEAGVNAYQQQQQTQWQQQQPQPNFWQEPDKYIDQKMLPRDVMNIAQGRMTAQMYFERNLSPRDLQVFRKYQREIDQSMNSYQPYQQTLPQNWFIAFNYIKGLHGDEVAKMEAEGTPFFSEPGSRGGQPEPPPEDKLTPDEEDIVRRMHFDPKGYLEQKKQMTLHQGEKGAFARYPVPVKNMGDRYGSRT